MGKRIIEEPRTIVAADIVGPLPLSKKGKNQYILVFEEIFCEKEERFHPAGYRAQVLSIAGRMLCHLR